jgi:hypothetical protein
MRINLHIERMLLDGVAVGDTLQFKLAMERELREALEASALAPQFRHGACLPKLTIPKSVLQRRDRPELLARDLGQAVYGSIGTPPQRPSSHTGADQ